MTPVLDLAWRTAFRLGFPICSAWWHLRRPLHQGAMVVIHVGSALLLLRQSYKDAWTFPGGSLHRGEAPETAARREVMEEIGLAALALLPAGVIHGLWDGRRDTVYLFEAWLDRLPELKLDNRKIVAARLVAPDELAVMRLSGPVRAYIAARNASGPQ